MKTERELEAVSLLTNEIFNEVFTKKTTEKKVHLSVSFTLDSIFYKNRNPKELFSIENAFSSLEGVLVHLLVHESTNSKVDIYSARIHLKGNDKEKMRAYASEMNNFCVKYFGKELQEVCQQSYPQEPQKI